MPVAADRSSLRAAVIGYGVMGHNHARVLHALGVTVVTVDPDPAAGAQVRSLGEAGPVQIACVATPHQHLAEQAADALHRGLDVLVEKPMALTARDADELAGIAAQAESRLAVGYIERHNPAVRALHEHLHQAGEIDHVAVDRLGPAARSPVSPALDLMTHDLDFLRSLGFTPQVRHASGAGHVTAVLDLDSGAATATLQGSHRYPIKRRQVHVTGEAGLLRLDYQTQDLVFYHPGGELKLPVPAAEPLRCEWEAFLAGEPMASAADAGETLRLALEIDACRAAPADAWRRPGTTVETTII